MVVFGQKLLYYVKLLYIGKRGCNRAKVVVFGQNWMCSGILILLGQSGSIRASWLYLGKNGCIRAKVVVFGQIDCIRS